MSIIEQVKNTAVHKKKNKKLTLSEERGLLDLEGNVKSM